MHVQIVTFGLDGMPEHEYIDIATRLTPRFAALPGLLAKVWLESPDSGTYGAIYFWEDQEAMERFVASDLFEGTHPGFAGLDSSDFSVLGNLTRATQPALTVVEDPAPRGRAPEPPPPPPAPPAGRAAPAKVARTAKTAKVAKAVPPAKPARTRAAKAPAAPPAKPRARRPAG